MAATTHSARSASGEPPDASNARWTRPSPGRWLYARRLTFLSLATAMLLWWYLSNHVIHRLLLPTPAIVAETFWTMFESGEWWRHTWASAQRILLGFVNGAFWGVLFGVLMGRYVVPRRLITPLLNLVRPLSPVALSPLAILWFGIGEFAKVMLAGYTSFVVILFNTMTGVASTPVNRERAALCMGANQRDLLRYVVLPSAVPSMLTGLRIGMGLAFVSIVAAELIAADSGLGFLIIQSRFSMLVDRIFVGLGTLALLGYFADVAFRKVASMFGGLRMAAGGTAGGGI